MSAGWQIQPAAAPSPRAQAATWLRGSACLTKTEGTSFFNVIITKIKGGGGKTPETSMALQWLYFPGVSFSQENGTALLWAGEPLTHNWQRKPKMNFVYADSKAARL